MPMQREKQGKSDPPHISVQSSVAVRFRVWVGPIGLPQSTKHQSQSLDLA
jgi:hypothetical protein